jgi:uncharacterized repeat protein (TIGR01451 family)
MISRTHIAARLLVLFALFGAAAARAQTAFIPALTGQSCAGTRAAKSLGCNAKDFTTTATFTQPASNTLSSCVAGSTVFVDLIANMTSGSPIRYNGALFFGEVGNDPSVNDATKTCSVGVFPTTPLPYEDLDGNVCGDYAGSSSSTLQVTGVAVKCLANPSSGGHLVVPFTVVWDNGAGTPTSCTAANVTASTGAKCVTNLSQQVTTLGGGPVTVQGFLNVTKQVSPAGDPTVFSFTADGGTVAPTPTTFSESATQTQQVLIPLPTDGGVQNLEVDETLIAGWSSTASISCTGPSGGAAAFVTVDNSNRRVIAALDATNYGANCTITNLKAAKVTLIEQSVGGTAAFSFTGGTNGLPASLTLDTTTGNPKSSSQFTLLNNAANATISQTVPSGWTVSASCSDGTNTFGSISPAGLLTIPSANLTANANITCTIVDTRGPTLTKAFSPSIVAPGVASTLTFTLTNSTGNPAQSGLGFTDTFPAGLVVATPLTVTNTCGGSIFRSGTVTAVAAGDPGIALSGGAIASGTASCTIAIKVSSATAGSYTNGAAQISGLAGGVINGVTNQVLTVNSLPVLTLVKSADAPTKAPGALITYTITAANTGTGNATTVMLSDKLAPYTAFSLNGFGAGVPFQFTDGSPSSGLTMGAPSYSSNGGATFTYTPVSGGGGAPAGFDANVTNWKLPMTGSMPPNGTCSVQFKSIVQ